MRFAVAVAVGLYGNVQGLFRQAAAIFSKTFLLGACEFSEGLQSGSIRFVDFTRHICFNYFHTQITIFLSLPSFPQLPLPKQTTKKSYL